MSVCNVISLFNKLYVHSALKGPLLRNISTNTPAQFRATQVLLAEPLKKKKRLDPAVVRAREERKKKKIEKQIRKLEKNARKPKPIEECEVPLSILDSRSKRIRDLPIMTTELLENRALLEKKWCQYKREQHLKDVQMLDRIMFSQQKALDELQKESEELYNEALQYDVTLMPFKSEGPVEVPSVDNYDAPDGDYQDISKKW